MLIACIRTLFQLLVLILLLLITNRVLTYHPENFSAIKQFFTESPACESAPCFIGIVPDETEQHEVYAYLNQAPFVADFRMAQVEFGLGRMFIEWNGEQASYIVDEGFISLVGERVETIELDTTLKLGEILFALGEPTQELISTFHVYLYYLGDGIVIETAVNCDAIWYSPVRVIYRSRPVQLSALAPNRITITDYCR